MTPSGIARRRQLFEGRLMQTFLPYADFVKTAKVLDRQRLGKQRVEAMQILRTRAGDTSGWQHHPAVRMWSNHERWLARYGMLMCLEWITRGYNDTCYDKIHALSARFSILTFRPPEWLGRNDFHASHRSNLLRKDPQHYGQFGWREPPDLPYVWPVERRTESAV